MSAGNLLRALLHGGVAFGEAQQEQKKRARAEEGDALQKRIELLKFAALNRDWERGADPTRYATHQGRTYDLSDPAQKTAYEAVVAPDVNWQTVQTDKGFVQVNPRTGATRPVQGGIQPKPPASATRPPNPTNWQTVQTDDGFAQVNPETGQTRPVAGIRPKPTAGESDPMKGVPTTVQSAIVAAQGVNDALKNYEGIVTQYMGQGRGTRLLGKVGLGGADQDAILGQMESAKYALKLQLKDLAALGALSGPDMVIVDQMIGDATSLESLRRDPAFVLSRIGETQKFIDDKVRAYEQTYGLKVPRSPQGGYKKAPF